MEDRKHKLVMHYPLVPTINDSINHHRNESLEFRDSGQKWKF